MQKWLSTRLFFSGLFAIFLLTLLVAPFWAQVKREVEPNDNREQAQEIRVGESVEGYFQKDYDYDWYKLTVEKSGKNHFQADLNAVPGMNTFLNPYDANGQQLVEVNDEPQNEAESIIGFPVEPGIYYIEVLGWSPCSARDQGDDQTRRNRNPDAQEIPGQVDPELVQTY